MCCMWVFIVPIEMNSLSPLALQDATEAQEHGGGNDMKTPLVGDDLSVL